MSIDIETMRKECGAGRARRTNSRTCIRITRDGGETDTVFMQVIPLGGENISFERDVQQVGEKGMS